MRRFAFILVATTVALAPYLARSEDTEQSTAQAAALTVAVAAPRTLEWPVTIPASGRLAAWHEAVIAAEVSGLKISDVRADVGTAVKKRRSARPVRRRDLSSGTGTTEGHR